jgi:hypothetical protein
MSWGPTVNGLQMAVWPSPVRSVVFAAIRNASGRTIHYCDYLLGYFENVRLFARPVGETEWKPIPFRSTEGMPSIGVLLCGPNDSLRSGLEMPPNWSRLTEGTKISRNYAFTEDIADYTFPAEWKGKVECKLTQTIFGGRYKDSWEGKVESGVFQVTLPLQY